MSRLPTLGPRGEGWFATQVALFLAIAASGAVGPGWTGAARTVTAFAGAALIAAGGILAIRGVLDLRENLTPLPYPVDRVRLVDTGVYALVRHPIYTGLIVASFGWGLATASVAALLGALVLAAFFQLKSRREEAWLAVALPGYDEYRRRTGRFMPRRR